MLQQELSKFALKSRKYHIEPRKQTFGKFTSKAAIIAIVEEQTNAAELDSPEPVKRKYCPLNITPSTNQRHESL